MKIIRLRTLFPPVPSSCRWCAQEERGHGRRWVPSQGWHTYAQPTLEQMAARIRARNAWNKEMASKTTLEQLAARNRKRAELEAYWGKR